MNLGELTRTRSALTRRGIRLSGFRVAEPQHDGAPHRHLRPFMDPGYTQTVREILAQYAVDEDGEEPGARDQCFKL